MELSPQQVQAYDGVQAWLPDDTRQVYRLDGYAGTGKTTIAGRLTENFDGSVLFGTFTGKAASVLCKKGIPAQTLHSLLYIPVTQDKNAIDKLKFEMKSEADPTKLATLQAKFDEMNQVKFEWNPESPLKDCDLLVVDEVSMVGEELGLDLLRWEHLKILVLGDPGQLPPISGAGFFQTKFPCDMQLTEIHRQARDNPIIMMATLVRQGHALKPGRYGTSNVISSRSILNEMYTEADQVIVGRNLTRGKVNQIVRDAADRHSPAYPDVGEKIICLRNDKKLGVLNGTQWEVVRAEDEGVSIAMALQPWDDKPLRDPIVLNSHPFNLNLSEMTWYEKKRHQEFDFGYAITCHKSQGSQWDKVFIVNESWCFKENAKQWLYTALTRAAETVLVAL